MSALINRRHTEIVTYIVNNVYVVHPVVLMCMKQINETARRTFVSTICNQSFVFSYTHVMGYILNLYFFVCWWLARKAETCSSRLTVRDMSDCCIYVFLLCFRFFTYLTTSFWLQVYCSVELYASLFILDIIILFLQRHYHQQYLHHHHHLHHHHLCLP
jgi:hypothetical protein